MQILLAKRRRLSLSLRPYATQFRKLFGPYNIGQMIETSYLSVSAIFVSDGVNSKNVNDEPLAYENLMGFAVLSDTPRAGLSEDWLGWFSETHAPADAEVTIANTLWVEFAVAIGTKAAAGRVGEGHEEEDEAAGVIENIVRTVFNTLPEVIARETLLPGKKLTQTQVVREKQSIPGSMILPSYAST